MNEEKLFKATGLPGHVKDLDAKKGIVKAYFAVFGNVDSDNDIIEPGAFAKSIRERGPDGTGRIKHLKYHDTRQAPGKIMELGEDGFGGWFISQLAKNSEGEFIDQEIPNENKELLDLLAQDEKDRDERLIYKKAGLFLGAQESEKSQDVSGMVMVVPELQQRLEESQNLAEKSMPSL